MYNYVVKTKTTDEAIRSLKAEVDSLHLILVALDASLNDPSLQSAVNSEHVRQHWKYLERSLKDCQKTLERLDAILERIKTSRLSVGNQIDLDASSEAITLLKRQITAYRQTMGLSLDLIIVYVLQPWQSSPIGRRSVLMTENYKADISSRLDCITIELQQLSRFLNTHSWVASGTAELDSLVVQNLKSCVRSGGLIMTGEFGCTLTDQQKTRVDDCLSNSNSQILWRETPTPSSLSTMLYQRELVHEEIEIDQESHLIVVQRSIESATIKFDSGHHSEALVLLESILTRSEAIFRENNDRRHEIMEMLAMCHCHRGEWDAAQSIMDRLLKEQPNVAQRGKQGLGVMHALAEACLEKKDFKNAENWCQRAMRGRRKSLGDQHALYYKSVTLLVEILEEQGKQVDADGYKGLLHGHSSIHDYVCQGDERTVRLLLEKVSANDRDIALTVAVYKGHEGIVQLLLENGANANVKEIDGEPVLIIAARKGHTEVVRLLLASGADIEAKDTHGETAMMLAAMKNHERVVGLLLEERADAEVKNRYALTALNFAERNENEIIVRLLKKHRHHWYQFGARGRRECPHQTGQMMKEKGRLEDQCSEEKSELLNTISNVSSTVCDILNQQY